MGLADRRHRTFNGHGFKTLFPVVYHGMAVAILALCRIACKVHILPLQRSQKEGVFRVKSKKDDGEDDGSLKNTSGD